MTRNRTIGAASALFIGLIAQLGAAQAAPTESFASPANATRALYEAVRKNDSRALTGILGAGNEFVSAEDPDQDRREREQFLRKYGEMHRLAREGDLTILYIGAENWPFPFPLVAQSGAWHFDAAAGMEEVLARRIGENELAAVVASRELAQEKHDATPAAGAGLQANVGDDRVITFRGYHFRRLTGGEDVIAYPAQYRVTGVMTFVAGRDGVVYEKDLGPQSTELAQDIGKVRPLSSWQRLP